jgi:regulator of ribonuclease activity A
MSIKTADLLDAHPEFEACASGLTHFGGLKRFAGPVATLQCFEDNSLIREALRSPGFGRVLVVDGGASQRCALVGDVLAAAGRDSGWVGVIVNGCVRDSVVLGELAFGVMALGVQPRRSEKRGQGVRDGVLELLGARVRPNDTVYVDEDGIVFVPQGITI